MGSKRYKNLNRIIAYLLVICMLTMASFPYGNISYATTEGSKNGEPIEETPSEEEVKEPEPEVEEYEITYLGLEDAIVDDNPEVYTIETESFTLNNPEKEGYIFEGWEGTDLDEASDNVIIEEGSENGEPIEETPSEEEVKEPEPEVEEYEITYWGLEDAIVDENPEV